jgi:hypothetical protein
VTTLASWISVDGSGPSAIYVVADSRITWGSHARRWDSGRKVFPANSADVFAYCGDVLFPSLVLGQITDLIDRNLLWAPQTPSDARHEAVVTVLQTAFERQHQTPKGDFSIFHCSREGQGVGSVFNLWRIDYSARPDVWADCQVEICQAGKSRLLLSGGSGRPAFEEAIAEWSCSPQGGTARAVFSAFCETLEIGKDRLSGGVPQIAALDRNSCGKLVGFVSEDMRYLYGLPVAWSPDMSKIEWVDRLFQRISPETLRLLSGAQRHAKVVERNGAGLTKFLRRISNRGATECEP